MVMLCCQFLLMIKSREDIMNSIKFEIINGTLCRMVEPEPQPAKEPIANCDNCKHTCTNSNIDYCHMYEPKPKFKVGDCRIEFVKQELHNLLDKL
jgi:hypothetical protein